MEENEMEMEDNNDSGGWKSKLKTTFSVVCVLGFILVFQ